VGYRTATVRERLLPARRKRCSALSPNDSPTVLATCRRTCKIDARGELLETQEEQDRWLLENKNAINDAYVAKLKA
jgi:hypothetical protein